MKKQILSLFFALVFTAQIFVIPSSAADTTKKFAPITAKEMVKLLAPGITFANTTEARSWPGDEWKATDTETCWGQPRIEEWQIKSAAMKGFKSYRLCVSWTPHMNKNGKIDKAWLDRIQEITDWCLDAGLYVLINTHHEEELYWMIRDGKYEEAKKHLTSIWSQVAERFKDYPEKVFFEIMNEPNLQSKYGAEDRWIWDENGNVSQKLCDTVNKLNTDALNVIRKSGGYNDKRCVMLGIPGAHPSALPYMIVPDDAYVMLGSFGYESNINEDTLPLIQAWIDKGVPFVNKEDMPGEIARTTITDRVNYAKKHFGELAKMGVPTFYFTGGASNHDKAQIIDRTTGKWINKSILEAYLSAYGVKPGADMKKPPFAFPYELKETFKDETYAVWEIPSGALETVEKMVVEIDGSFNWYAFAKFAPEFKQFDKGDKRITEENGKITFDLRGLDATRVGFLTWNKGDAAKIKSVYLDTWSGSDVKLSSSSETLVPKETVTLKLNGADSSVTWDSSDNKIATVSSNGKITAVATGKTTITAKYNGKSYTCDITVSKTRIKRKKSTIKIGETVACNLLGDTSGNTVKWSSEDKRIAAVDSNGNVKGIKAGKVEITAAYGTNKTSFTMTIK